MLVDGPSRRRWWEWLPQACHSITNLRQAEGLAGGHAAALMRRKPIAQRGTGNDCHDARGPVVLPAPMGQVDVQRDASVHDVEEPRLRRGNKVDAVPTMLCA